MSTKFVSKNSNLMVVLKPGVPGSTITGQQPTPGIYVRFQGGTVDVKEEAILNMLRRHSGFGSDFVEIKQEESDPFEHTRKETEPDHKITEMEYGHVGKTKTSKGKTVLSPELKKIIEAEAIKMLPGLLKKNPKILKDILSGLAEEVKKDEADVESKQEPGRPSKESDIDTEGKKEGNKN